MMFEIKHQDPILYRRETRRSTLVIAVVFVLLGLVLSGLAVKLLGEPGGDNFRYNLGGVIASVLVCAALVRFKFWSQPWMAPAAYGWQLKRNLMRVTNVMHHVTAGVAAGDETAMKLLRFYHLGLTQMHLLDANTSALSQSVQEIDRHRERMLELGLEPEQIALNPQWLAHVKQIPAAR